MRGRGAPKGGAVLPPKPKGWEDAKLKLAEAIGTAGHVGWGFVATPGSEKPGEGAWNLYVWTDDEGLKVPSEFNGIPVTKRKKVLPGTVSSSSRRSRR
jgi:hypothetical protein